MLIVIGSIGKCYALWRVDDPGCVDGITGSSLHDVDVVQFISEVSVLLKPVPNMDGTLSPNHSVSELVVQGAASIPMKALR